jgi:hypothetical protein
VAAELSRLGFADPQPAPGEGRGWPGAYGRLQAQCILAAQALLAGRHPLAGVDQADDDDAPEPLDPPRFVHATELENRTGHPLRLTLRVRTSELGRTTLTLRVEVAP